MSFNNIKSVKVVKEWTVDDQEAENQGQAIRDHRVSKPVIMGKRIAGTKTTYRKTKPATAYVMRRLQEELGAA